MLLSQATRTLTGSTLPAGVDVFPPGERHLKDIDEPVLEDSGTTPPS